METWTSRANEDPGLRELTTVPVQSQFQSQFALSQGRPIWSDTCVLLGPQDQTTASEQPGTDLESV